MKISVDTFVFIEIDGNSFKLTQEEAKALHKALAVSLKAGLPEKANPSPYPQIFRDPALTPIGPIYTDKPISGIAQR